MDTLILNGHDLTLQDVYDVAYDGRKVEIAADAYARLAKGREIMQELSKGGKAIYGFNRGVGQNKDVSEYLSGNLCRCTGYQSQLRSIRNFLNSKKEGAPLNLEAGVYGEDIGKEWQDEHKSN